MYGRDFFLCETLWEYMHFKSSLRVDKVAEWLRRWTANPLCSARMGSNPILVELFCCFLPSHLICLFASSHVYFISEFPNFTFLPCKYSSSFHSCDMFWCLFMSLFTHGFESHILVELFCCFLPSHLICLFASSHVYFISEFPNFTFLPCKYSSSFHSCDMFWCLFMSLFTSEVCELVGKRDVINIENEEQVTKYYRIRQQLHRLEDRKWRRWRTGCWSAQYNYTQESQTGDAVQPLPEESRGEASPHCLSLFLSPSL